MAAKAKTRRTTAGSRRWKDRPRLPLSRAALPSGDNYGGRPPFHYVSVWDGEAIHALTRTTLAWPMPEAMVPAGPAYGDFAVPLPNLRCEIRLPGRRQPRRVHQVPRTDLGGILQNAPPEIQYPV